MAHRIETLQEYYADPDVRGRIAEYCGGRRDGPPTAAFLAAMTGSDGPLVSWDHAPRFPVNALGSLLSMGADVSRSMWDTANLLFHLDLDYQNTDFPGEPYHHPAEAFFKVEPVYRAARHVLGRLGVPVVTLMTGRGYHFTARLPLASDVIDGLGALAPDSPRWLRTLSERRPPWMAATITPRHARAYVGAGMLTEFLAHRVMKRAAPRSAVAIVLNGTVVGSGIVGRESVSIDLSYAGDPLDIRHVRVAFGAYQKHRFRPDLVGHGSASRQPPLVAVPRRGESLRLLLAQGRDLRHAARAARARSVELPDAAEGIGRAIAAYHRSSLAAFHRAFYATPVRRGAERDDLWRQLPLASLPPCVVGPLAAPNDLLLQPAVIQHVTRVLLADGMRPRDIAAVVHARYAADFGWGTRWAWLDAQTRAEFDVRVFAGLAATGTDGAIDMNCRSAQEKGLCPGGQCGRDLRVDRARLLEVMSS
jgi:hypothetical protein